MFISNKDRILIKNIRCCPRRGQYFFYLYSCVDLTASIYGRDLISWSMLIQVHGKTTSACKDRETKPQSCCNKAPWPNDNRNGRYFH